MIVIENINQVYELISVIKSNINLSAFEVEKILRDSPIEALALLKFDRVVYDPMNGEKINFIEMLNQAYSDLVVLYAVEYLIDIYPDKKFILNLGALNGFDISSADHTVIAECFAVVSVMNNQKIIKDSNKLMRESSEKEKFVFFYSKEENDEAINRIKKKYPEISYKRIDRF